MNSKNNCNWCGLKTPFSENFVKNFGTGITDFFAQGGYPSTPGNGEGALDDCTAYDFSLCEYCLDYLFGLFKNPPIVKDVMRGYIKEKFRPAVVRIAEDKWRTWNPSKFFEEAEKRQKARNLIMDRVLVPLNSPED